MAQISRSGKVPGQLRDPVRGPRPGTVLVRSGVQYNNKTMCNHGGATRSCSSFADMVLKSLQVVKEKLALTTYQLFMTRS